jgi:uncharacterized protein with HEPN domain
MAARSLAPRLTDIIEAIDHIRSEMAGVSIEAFEADWRKQWLVERGVEIISEASRHLTDELKARHPEIPWPKVAGIGNVLRHDYASIAAPIMWKPCARRSPAFGTGLSRGVGARSSGRKQRQIAEDARGRTPP